MKIRGWAEFDPWIKLVDSSLQRVALIYKIKSLPSNPSPTQEMEKGKENVNHLRKIQCHSTHVVLTSTQSHCHS